IPRRSAPRNDMEKLSNVGAEQERRTSRQMRLALMGIDGDGHVAGLCPGIGQVLRPGFDAETEKILGHRRFLASFEIRHRLEFLDVPAVENEMVTIPLAAVHLGKLLRHQVEY